MKTTRREFVSKTSKACVGIGYLGAMVSLLDGCVANYMVESRESGNKITVDKGVLVDTGSGEKKRFVTVQSKQFKEAIYLSGIPSENYAAVLTHCTHKGCEVRPAGHMLVCPCHGSEFSALGKVLKPPAERDLVRFPVNHDRQHVYIHLSGN